MRAWRYVGVAVMVATLASPAGFGGVAFGAGKKAAHEGPQISLDQVPAAAKATIEREAQGGTVQQVTQDMEKGKTVYEAEIAKNGKSRFVSVAEDGKIVKRRESAKKEAKEEAGRK